MQHSFSFTLICVCVDSRYNLQSRTSHCMPKGSQRKQLHKINFMWIGFHRISLGLLSDGFTVIYWKKLHWNLQKDNLRDQGSNGHIKWTSTLHHRLPNWELLIKSKRFLVKVPIRPHFPGQICINFMKFLCLLQIVFIVLVKWGVPKNYHIFSWSNIEHDQKMRPLGHNFWWVLPVESPCSLLKLQSFLVKKQLEFFRINLSFSFLSFVNPKPIIWGWVKTLVHDVNPKIAGIHGCSSH